jgi:hypothetical protein
MAGAAGFSPAAAGSAVAGSEPVGVGGAAGAAGFSVAAGTGAVAASTALGTAGAAAAGAGATS